MVRRKKKIVQFFVHRWHGGAKSLTIHPGGVKYLSGGGIRLALLISRYVAVLVTCIRQDGSYTNLSHIVNVNIDIGAL